MPEGKFGKAGESHKEVLSEKRGRNLEEENLNKNAPNYYGDTPGRKSKSHPDPNKYS